MSSKRAITRSPGLPTGYFGLVAGGGYSGITGELDRVVAEQAELLSKAFDRAVEIRFNSDRRSGGAWLKDGLPGFSGSSQVGFSASLSAKPPAGKTYSQWLDDLHAEHSNWSDVQRVLDKAPQEIVISTYISSTAAKDPAIVTEGPKDSRYASTRHHSLREGLEFLKKHVDRSKLNPETLTEVADGDTPPRVSAQRGRTRSTRSRSPKGGPGSVRGIRG